MRFSMNSYLLGVGTVVGALTFGFGGGILLTKTAIKDTPAGPSRIERAARVGTGVTAGANDRREGGPGAPRRSGARASIACRAGAASSGRRGANPDNPSWKR